MFQETEISYISQKADIENPDICRTQVYLEPKAYLEHYQKSTMERFSKMATRSTFLHSRI